MKEKGKVFIQFTVDTLGRAGEFKIVKGYNELADSIALQVIKDLDFPFNPARQRGRAVKSRMIFPITFDPGAEWE